MAERSDIELAEVFAEVARSLVVENQAEATLMRICTTAVEMIDACEHAGMSLIRGRRIEPGAGTDEVPRRIDEIQSEVQEGPCIDAIKEHEVFRTGRLSREDRWPRFSTRAHEETGVESILSFRLFADEGTMGSLNLYSSQVDAFDDDDVAIGAVFAAHAGVAMVSSRREENLGRQVESRDVIGVAKGILMTRLQVSEDDAFGLLVGASQHLNLKLRRVAEEVALTGALPGDESQTA